MAFGWPGAIGSALTMIASGGCADPFPSPAPRVPPVAATGSGSRRDPYQCPARSLRVVRSAASTNARPRSQRRVRVMQVIEVIDRGGRTWLQVVVDRDIWMGSFSSVFVIAAGAWAHAPDHDAGSPPWPVRILAGSRVDGRRQLALRRR